MSTTLIDSVRGVFTEPVIAKFSVLLGEPEGNIQKAVNGAIPMVLTDIVHKSHYVEGSGRIHSLATQAAASDFFGLMHEMTTGTGGLVPGSVLLNKGAEFARALLGNRFDPAVAEVARFANIGIPSAAFIVGIAAFAALDTIGRYIVSATVDANGLVPWLRPQADGIVVSMPTGLEVKPALGILHYPWEKRVVVRRRNTALYVVLVLVILAVVGLLVYRHYNHMDTTFLYNTWFDTGRLAEDA